MAKLKIQNYDLDCAVRCRKDVYLTDHECKIAKIAVKSDNFRCMTQGVHTLIRVD